MRTLGAGATVFPQRWWSGSGGDKLRVFGDTLEATVGWGAAKLVAGMRTHADFAACWYVNRGMLDPACVYDSVTDTMVRPRERRHTVVCWVSNQ